MLEKYGLADLRTCALRDKRRFRVSFFQVLQGS